MNKTGVWVPDSTDHTKRSDARAPARGSWSAVELEQDILDVLVSAPDANTLELAFLRKEAALMELFDRLTITDAHELRRRLLLGLPGDQIAARFAGLIVERRQRLLAFLAGARRRAALRAGAR